MAVTLSEARPPDDREQEQAFLRWFGNRKMSLFERPLELGGLKYHLFLSNFKLDDGSDCACYGKDEDRIRAALKCAGETVEREAMTRFFCSGQNETMARQVSFNKLGASFGSEVSASLAPIELRNSNGWSVHMSEEMAKKGAILEAFERHLILKSFVAFGWRGFTRVKTIRADEMTFYMMTSRFTVGGIISGMVAAKSQLHPGLSLGYCAGKTEDINGADFWKPALFEASDKILLLRGRKISLSESQPSWMLSEIKKLLENDFDLDLLPDGMPTEFIEDEMISFNLKSWNLSQQLGLEFPLFASFAWGGDLIPLFHFRGLSESAREYVKAVLLKNGLVQDLPSWHPVL